MEPDDVAGVGPLSLQHMAGRDIQQGHRHPCLHLDEASAELSRVLPSLASIALNSCRLKETGLVLEVGRADDQVPLHRALLYDITVLLELVELLPELRHILLISLGRLVELDHQSMLVDLVHHGADKPDKPVDDDFAVLRIRVIPVKSKILKIVSVLTCDVVQVKLALPTKDVEPEVDRHVLDIKGLRGLKGTFSLDNERADDFRAHCVGLVHQGSEVVHVDGHGV